MATSAEIKTSLKTKLIAEAQIATSEPITSSLDDFLDRAFIEYSPGRATDYTTLETKEHELVLLLAWIRVCDSRASLAAPQASMRGVGAGFGSDRDTPFEKNTKLAKFLRERYTNLRASLFVDEEGGDSGDITVGDLVRRDEFIDAKVPLKLATALRAPALSLRSQTAVSADPTLLGTAILTWPQIYSEGFDELIIVGNDASGIQQDWNSTGNGKIPRIAADATEVFRTTDSRVTTARITGLAAGAAYFVIAVRDMNGNYSFSNELTVTIAA